MPLVFIHGVNTRSTDADYTRGVEARRMMFDQLAARKIRERYPGFRVADDVYWGDLGVDFLWRLRSIPDIRQKYAQGPEGDEIENPDLLALMIQPAEGKKPDEKREHLGAAQPLAEAARRDPARLVRALFAGEADRFAPPLFRPPALSGKQTVEPESAVAQGENLGLLLMAVDQFARKVAEQPGLIQGATDSDVLAAIQNGIDDQYRSTFETARADREQMPGDKEHLGKISDGIGWTRNYLKKAVEDARDFVSKQATAVARDASLELSGWLRDPLSRKGLRFLGDVLVYLHHGIRRLEGSTGSESIYDRVRSKLLALKQAEKKEPLVVVTHSFGSEILYDLLTSGGLKDLDDIDLWVTVGAQTSLFAEMRLFAWMAKNIPEDTEAFTLGLPPKVKNWVNFYDPADVLSYMHGPVFGKVKDIAVDDGGNLKNAHGHYFVTTSFYENVLKELQEALPK